ncbi:MAG: hypothetical protein AB1546_03385 [bacterium]
MEARKKELLLAPLALKNVFPRFKVSVLQWIYLNRSVRTVIPGRLSISRLTDTSTGKGIGSLRNY